MQPRFFRSGLLAALVALAAACADQTPTLAGDEEFPPGSIPVTRELLVPASEFFELLGTFSGYTGAAGAPFLVAANDYRGLDANILARFSGFPLTVAYQRDGVEVRDTAFEYVDSRLVVRVDTAASTHDPVTLQLWEAVEGWHPGSATWEVAVDTGSVRTLWTQPGGTRGDLLAEAVFTPDGTTGDSLVFHLSPEAVVRLADTLSQGVVVTAKDTGARVELADLLLRASVRPDNAVPDTIIVVAVGTSGSRTTVFTPEQPDPGAGELAVGGVRSARTLFRLDPAQLVPGCAVGVVCDAVPLTQVRLNQVAILLRPVDVPDGFDPLAPMPLSLRVVQEPELGRFAPLGQSLLDRQPVFSVRDTLLALPVTGLVTTLGVIDTLPTTFALVSESPLSSLPPTFGAAFFDAEPWLRIVYTIPSRRRLP